MTNRRRWNWVLVICFFMVLFVDKTVYAEGRRASPVLFPRRISAPRIDGRLDDAGWQKAEKVTDFILVDGKKPSVGTTAYIGYDNKNFYIAFRCEEKEMDKLQESARKRDDAVWRDDSIEIFLDTNLDRSSYFHFLLNTINTRMDQTRSGGGQTGDVSWNPRWKTQVSKGKDYWIAEIAIPFKELGTKCPAENTFWAGNLHRVKRTSPREYSFWTLVGDYAHNPSAFGRIFFGSFREELKYEISEMQEKLKEFPSTVKELAGMAKEAEKVRTKDEWLGLYARIKQSPEKVRKERVHALKKMGYIVWQKNPFTPFSVRNLPLDIEHKDEIGLFAAQDEYEAISLIISNLSKKSFSARIILDKFRFHREDSIIPQVIEPDFITVRDPVFVKVGGNLIPDALPRLEGDVLQVTVPGKESRELFLTVNTKGLSPGRYEGLIHIEPGFPFPRRKIKINLEVAPFSIKKKNLSVLVYFGGYCYDKATAGIIDKDIEKYLKDIAEHRGKVLITGQGGPPGAVVKDGKFIGLNQRQVISYGRVIKSWREYAGEDACINVNLVRAGHRVAEDFMSPEWKDRYKKRLFALLELIEKEGIKKDKIAIASHDEVGGEKGVNLFSQESEFMKEIYPQAKIYLTQGSYTKLEDIKACAPYVDVWCPHVSHLGDKDKMAVMRGTGKSIWFYNNNIPVQWCSPLVARAQGWIAFHHNLQGCGFWCYEGFESDHWYGGGRVFMVYISPDGRGPIPSRRWEAYREGVEDYEYFYLLEESIKKAKEGVDTTTAEGLLKRLRADLEAEKFSQNPELIYQYRKEVAKEIVKLRK